MLFGRTQVAYCLVVLWSMLLSFILISWWRSEFWCLTCFNKLYVVFVILYKCTCFALIMEFRFLSLNKFVKMSLLLFNTEKCGPSYNRMCSNKSNHRCIIVLLVFFFCISGPLTPQFRISRRTVTFIYLDLVVLEILHGYIVICVVLCFCLFLICRL